MLNAIAHQIYILIPFNFTVYIRFSVFIVDAFEDTFLLLLLTHHPPSEMTNFIFKCNNPLMFVIKMFLYVEVRIVINVFHQKLMAFKLLLSNNSINCV